MTYTREDVLRAGKRGVSPSARVDERRWRGSRRTFLQTSLASTGGLLVVFGLEYPAATRPQPPGASAKAFQPNGFVRIDPEGAVVVWSRNPDMGQGVRTSLSMIVAEELDADWTRVRVEDAPLDGDRYGPQGSGGSDSVASAWDDHRRAGALARTLLLAAAAAEWQLPVAECHTERGHVTHAVSGRSTSYGSLAGRAAGLTVSEANPALKRPDDYRLVGSRVRNVDAHDIVTGRRLFGLDVKLPGMKYAAIAKAPVFAGRPLTVDGSRALQVPGVRQVVEVHGLDNPTHLMPGVAVVADSTWAAFKGRDALAVEWTEGAFAGESSDTLRERYHALLQKPESVLHESGDVDATLASAAHIVENVYDYGFVAHATLEPHNCTADYRDGQCWIRGPLQMPASGRAVVARALGIVPEAVHVQSTRIGGGFGRRLLSDYAAEAAVVSRAIGAPVQVVDTRTGDLQHDYYRPAGAQRIRAGTDAESRLVAWDHTIVSVSRNAYRRDPRPPYSTETYGSFIGRVKDAREMDPDLVPTRIPHARLRYAAPRTGVPTGAWRAPSHVVGAFAIETTIDELATRAKRSAVDVRLGILGEPEDIPVRPGAVTTYDPNRMKRVLQVAAEQGGVGAKPPEGRARGFAAHWTFGSYCAEVVEVSIDDRKRIVVHRVLVVADVGQPVNRSGLEAQAEGGVVDGLGAAFFGDVPIERGRAMVANFDTYRLIRQREAPGAIDVVILPSHERPTGFGEIAVPPIAPAVANAIASLAGDRIRVMPFTKAGWTL